MVDNVLRKAHLHLAEKGGMIIKGKNEFGIEISAFVSKETAQLSMLGKTGFFFKEDKHGGISYYIPYKELKMHLKNAAIPLRLIQGVEEFPIDALHLIYELVAERYMDHVELSQSSYIQGLEEKYKEVLQEVDFWEICMKIPQC